MQSQPAAVLFDMDGTLIDSENYWLNSEQELANRYNASWTAADGEALIGMSLYDSAVILQQKMNLPMNSQQIIETLTDSVLAKLESSIEWRPGALELVRELKSRGIKTALVTMSMRRMALSVANADEENLFDVVIAGDDVTLGKPHPEPYLLAAAQLGVNISDCIAFEDSETGLRSAESSGAIAVGIPNIVRLAEQEGRIVWPTLENVTTADLIRLYQENRASNDQ
jgi:HAD superfamily hydrolase (TIGR01509 family)